MRWDDRHLAVPVLIARNPTWLDTWVNKHLDGEFPDLNWEEVCQFREAGVISKPDSDGYMNLFIQAMRGYDHQNKSSYVQTSERLRQNPDFLEDEIWRIFEYENHALTSDWSAKYKEAPENYQTWPEALVKLANEGDIDRDRLLDVSLASMQQEMKQNQLSAYGKLHDALKPSTPEMESRQQGYLELLVSPIGPVLSFAIKSLGKLHRAGKRDADQFVAGVRPVFAHKAKGTAMQALKIVDKLDTYDEQSAQGIADVAIAAMAHENPDVQEFGLKILEQKISSASDATLDDFQRHIPFLSAKLQVRAKDLLGDADPADMPAESTPAPTVDVSADLEELGAELRALAGIAGAPGDAMPDTLDYRILQLPCVADRVALEPIGTRDELLESTARLIERVDSPDQVEQLLDGIARLGQDKKGNFVKLAAPLAQRLEKGQPSSEGVCSGWGGVSVALVDLLMTWWTGRRYDSRKLQYYDESRQAAFGVARIREIQDGLVKGRAMPLLSRPSFTGGWLDPVEFATRVSESNGKSDLQPYDLMQALLRLGPGDRVSALKALPDRDDKYGRLVRFALGGDEAPKRSDRRDAHLWYCAARARDPEISDPKLLEPIASRIPNEGGTHTADHWSWHVKTEESHGHRHSKVVFDEGAVTSIESPVFYRRSRLKELKKKLTEPTWRDWPTAGLRTWPSQRWQALFQFSSEWSIKWLAMQHPADTESFMTLGVYLLDARINDNTSRDTPAHAFLSIPFDATRPWGEVTNLAVSLGLLSKSTDSRGYAIDALIPAIESGHARPDSFAEVLGKLVSDGAYKLNRLNPALTSVLEVSDLHKWWVGAVIDIVIQRVESLPKNAYLMYEVALECMLPLKVRPSEATASRLEQHKGSSKTAKLARELRSVEGPAINEPNKELASAAWNGRVQFASRFQPVLYNSRP